MTKKLSKQRNSRSVCGVACTVTLTASGPVDTTAGRTDPSESSWRQRPSASPQQDL
eukprot:CAMPEP_0174328730 /NCGR_PEP_ID=MMETSP0810-20121108/15327_1 /TAXON_ID=73025 ORGANISM="Eutreptiella gymnastica-like, Strain CCMP1594" /NCGR_SAMPLE_ID=MMETSP0810 /ASSEMBLY_ACC=CAM_ASM_000659 /LENGTH=55 /DNA_ID=CAMNT_0015442905 /DNA_START=43 /DNA_END=210 /DNA_ORIENTATION=+